MVNASREATLEWVRGHAPDIRIQYRIDENGKRVAGARFTFRGVVHTYGVMAGQQIPDPNDTIVRVCYRAIARELGMVEPHVRSGREREIMAAAAGGHTEQADAMAREVAQANAAETRHRTVIRSRFGMRSTW